MEGVEHQISILVENVLYRTIKDIADDKQMLPKAKRENIENAISRFVRECEELFQEMPLNEIRKHVIMSLDKIWEAMKETER